VAWDRTLLPADPARAIELYTRAAELYLGLCEKGDAGMCTDLDIWIEDGFDLAAYAKTAAAAFRRRHPRKAIFASACAAGSGYGCYQLGELAGPGRAQVELFEKGCDASYHGACQALGKVLEDGHGAERDPPAALDLYLRGCELDVGVCFEACRLGDELHTPRPAACKKACDAGYWPSACTMGR
jgi:TPR repeat protein